MGLLHAKRGRQCGAFTFCGLMAKAWGRQHVRIVPGVDGPPSLPACSLCSVCICLKGMALACVLYGKLHTAPCVGCTVCACVPCAPLCATLQLMHQAGALLQQSLMSCSRVWDQVCYFPWVIRGCLLALQWQVTVSLWLGLMTSCLAAVYLGRVSFVTVL